MTGPRGLLVMLYQVLEEDSQSWKQEVELKKRLEGAALTKNFNWPSLWSHPHFGRILTMVASSENILAIAVADQVLRLDEEFHPVHFTLGQLHSAVHLEPFTPFAFFSLARLFWNQILIWLSLSPSSWARARRRSSVRQRLAVNSSFSLLSWSEEKAVRGRLSCREEVIATAGLQCDRTWS